MKIIYFGTDNNSKLVLEDLNNSANDVELVITSPDSIKSRGNLKSPSPVKTYCIENKLNFIEKIPDQELIESINSDIIIVASYGQIIPDNILNSSFYGAINLHPSLLPKYPGLNTHQRVIENQDLVHGVSIHYVSSKLDCGPLIAQGEIKTKKYDDISHLIERIHKVEHLIYPEIIKYICEDRIHLESNEVKFKNITTTESIIYNKYEI